MIDPSPSRPVAAARAGARLSEAPPRAGAQLFGRATRSVLERPLLSLVWLFGLGAVVVVAPVWGAAFALMGWIAARDRMQAEGVAGLASVLAPAGATRQYERGLFSGLWRTQKLGWAIAIVQAPASLLAFAPAAIAWSLLAPAAALLPGRAGIATGLVVPGALALVAFVLVAAQSLLAHRLLAAVGPDYTVGLVARASGAAWRTTLREGAALAALAGGFVVLAIGGGLFVWANAELASRLSLGAGAIVVATWAAAVAGALSLAIVCEALADWAEQVDTEPFPTAPGFSLSAAIRSFLAHVTGGGARGLAAIGLFFAIAIGLAGAAATLLAGVSAASLGALGWFGATLLSLVALHIVHIVRRPS